MDLAKICLYVCFLSTATLGDSHALKISRASQRLTIELLIVSDYSEFNKWYQTTSSTDSHSNRVNEAKQKVREYVGALIHSSNNVYKSLEQHSIYINIKLVDVLIMTTPSDSPWTEKMKSATGSTYDVDPTRVLPLFQSKSVELQTSIPHDHAMILSQYKLYQGAGSTFSGYAYTYAECKPKSVSIVQDNDDLYTANLIAHEIGHSLGCSHDGVGNSCPRGAGYAMEAGFLLANRNKWIFSSCSITEIRNYLHDLNTIHRNCLKMMDNSHPDSHANIAAHEWFGQVYTLDEQCQIHYGQQSYLCRNEYHSDYTNVCLKMFCNNPKKHICYYIDGGDGTPCATGKWCMSNECVSNSGSHLLNIVDSCVVGDQPGVVYNGRTCQQIGTSHHSYCIRSDVKRMCCDACNQTTTFTTSTDIDGQCANKHGAGSFMCRGARSYAGKSYADTVCWDLQCHDPNRDNWCLSTYADDHTSCGTRKWCKNGVCVYNNSAPLVPDNCPWGDQKGVARDGMTCNDIKQPRNHWLCYDDVTAKLCCAACNSVLRNVKGCEYGDKQYSCVAYRCVSYSSDTLAKCCETCSTVPIVG